MMGSSLPPFEVFTLATRGYAPFVLNLEASLGRIGRGGELVAYALDDEVHAELQAAGMRSRRVGPDDHPAWSDYGTIGFARTMAFKYTIASQIVASGRAAWYVDGDVVFLKDPLPQLIDIVHGESPDLVMQYEDPPGLLNAGFWLALPTAPTAEFLTSVPPRLLTEEFTCDQKLVNEILTAEGPLEVVRLDPERFACGNQFLEGPLVEEGGVHVDRRLRPFPREEAFVLHFNFTIGLKQKLAAMERHDAIVHPALESLASERRRSIFGRVARRVLNR